MFRYLILLFLYLNTSAQTVPVARFSGMGNTGTALQGLGSLTSNPAGLVKLHTAQVASYYQQHFLNNNIRTVGALLALPTKFGTFGTHMLNYGIARVYADFKASFVFSRAFGHRIAIATAVNYHQLHIASYGASKTYSVDLGAQYHITPLWIVGGFIANLNNASYDKTAYAIIPVQLRLGTSYLTHQHLLITADVEQSVYSKYLDFRIGLEYKIMDNLCFRGGLALHEIKQFCGLGFRIKNMLLDMSTVIHPKLGVSPQLYIAYAF